MTEKQTPDRMSDEEFPKFLFQIVCWVVVAAFTVVAVYWFNFRASSLSKTAADWGTFGDYFGGLVNPIVGLTTVVLVVLSLIIQRREMRTTIEEMQAANENSDRTSFEQSLFAWLANYHSLISSIDTGTGITGTGFTGRRALSQWYELQLSPLRISRAFVRGSSLNIANPETLYDGNQIFLRLWVPGDRGTANMGGALKLAVMAYQTLHLENRSNLDAPFRTLYRLFKWIDESGLSIEQRWHYAALVRAQLSWSESVFLFYNALTKEGQKLAFYANKYALFDNLLGGDELIHFAVTTLTDLPAEDRPLVQDGPVTWPYKPSAFSSDLAREDLQFGAREATAAN